MYLPGTALIGGNNHLIVGGVDTVELAKTYGTPLYVYDVALIRERARSFQRVFQEEDLSYQVAYASKAFSCIAAIQLMKEEGLSLDVVSGGELYTALAAGFPSERIHFHGNNKSIEELKFALQANIGCFVVDNDYEMALLEELCTAQNKKTNILLRVTPGIEAHTHDYILTGQEDSKFGFDLHNGHAKNAIVHALNSEVIQLLGFHCHIGSQIFETEGFTKAIETLFGVFTEWEKDLRYFPSVINLGGGFGIRYTEEDQPLSPESYVAAMIQEIKRQMVQFPQYSFPEIWIEPGRSLVGDAGMTLYSVGAQKIIPGVRHYISVDGGMSDNIRPALYQAKYEAILANRVQDPADELVSIAGKCCESGDMLIWDTYLPKVNDQDLIAVLCTGAYGYSMANNYNRLPRPPVVFVEEGEAKLVVKRESYQDLIALDLPLSEKVLSHS